MLLNYSTVRKKNPVNFHLALDDVNVDDVDVGGNGGDCGGIALTFALFIYIDLKL